MQRETAGAAVTDTISAFGMYCMDIPFMMATKAKSLRSANGRTRTATTNTYPPKV